jgi:tRNA dimethylallyltransferase
VGVELARRLDAESLALDSMTLYRGMDIGTAKPSLAERGEIPHHLIDLLNPWESASVAQYQSWAGAALSDVEQRGKTALFVGGTPLYLKALLRGLFTGPAADSALRQSLEEEAERAGSSALHARLERIDPGTAARVHTNDLRRIIRALEVFEATGRPLSALQTQHSQPAPHVRVVALSRPRAELHDRIDRRVEAMFADGLVDEVRALLAGPHPLNRVPAQGVGYHEVIQFLEGQAPRDETIARVQARTRQFAKRQQTWFRGLTEVRLWAVERDEAAALTADRLEQWLSRLR